MGRRFEECAFIQALLALLQRILQKRARALYVGITFVNLFKTAIRLFLIQ